MPGYISEVKFEGGSDNFVEFAIPTGTDTSGYTFVIYNNNGTVISTHSLGPVVATINGYDVYVDDDLTGTLPDVRDNDAIALVDDTGTVLQFLGFKQSFTAIEGPANGMTTQITGDVSPKGSSVVTSDNGATYTTDSSPTPGTIPCFGPDTRIATPDGSVRADQLETGMHVTLFNGDTSQVVFVRRKVQVLADVGEDCRPVKLRRGALGAGRPSRDLVVSPQHRIAVGGKLQLPGLFAEPRLVPAKALVGLPGISRDRSLSQIVWTHFALERHSLVLAESCITESLLVGKMVLNGMTRLQRDGLLSVIEGNPLEADGPVPALPCLSVGDTVRRVRAWVGDCRPAPARLDYLRSA